MTTPLPAIDSPAVLIGAGRERRTLDVESPRLPVTTGASPGAQGVSPFSAEVSGSTPKKTRDGSLPPVRRKRGELFRRQVGMRRAGIGSGRLVVPGRRIRIRHKDRSATVSASERGFGFLLRDRGDCQKRRQTAAAVARAHISELPLVLRLTVGNCSGADRIAQHLRADRGGDVGRIEIGQRVNRRMRNGGADRPRQAEHGGVNGAEWRRDQMLARAFDDARLMRQQGAEILQADLVRQQRQRQGAETGFSPTLPHAHGLLTRQHFVRTLRRVARMRHIFLLPR